MAQINRSFSIERWAATCEMVGMIHGSREVERRIKPLPEGFKRELLSKLEDRRNERELGW